MCAENVFENEVGGDNRLDETPGGTTEMWCSPLQYGDEFNDAECSNGDTMDKDKFNNNTSHDKGLEESTAIMPAIMPAIIPAIIQPDQNIGDTIVPCEHLPNSVLVKNTVKQMQAWLRSKNQRVGGNKSQLMERYGLIL